MLVSNIGSSNMSCYKCPVTDLIQSTTSIHLKDCKEQKLAPS